MAYYTERNGLALYWDRDHMRLELAKWVYHHPDRLQAFVNKLAEYGIDLLNTEPTDDNPTYDIEILVRQLNELTDEDIDNITGVDLDGN